MVIDGIVLLAINVSYEDIHTEYSSTILETAQGDKMCALLMQVALYIHITVQEIHCKSLNLNPIEVFFS